MATRTTVGQLLLAASVMLLLVEFFWGLRPGSPPFAKFPTALVGLVPPALLMVSLYLLLSKKEVLKGRGKVARFIIVLLASWGVAGSAFLLLLVVGLYAFGPSAGITLFSHIFWLLPLGTIAAFPFVARRLR